MNSQELRALQEAYLNVYEENGDIKDRDARSSEDNSKEKYYKTQNKLRRKVNLSLISPEQRKTTEKEVWSNLQHKLETRKEKVKHRNPIFSRTRGDDALKMGKSPRNQKEQIDIYDIILSHLLDEGYAETPEAAEVMMVNMSEEWLGSIIG
jgi:hypothetical protein